MKLQNALIHILDKESGNLILSQSQLSLDNKIITNYILKLIKKFERSEYIEDFVTSSPILLQYNKTDFENFSSKIANIFFKSIKDREMIPGGDLLFFRAKDNDGNSLFGFFKLDYSSEYLHNIIYNSNILKNDIILNRTVLPSIRKKINEGVMVYNNHKIAIRSKTYTDNQGSWNFLKDVLKMKKTPKKISETLNEIKDIVYETSTDFGENELNVDINLKNAIHESMQMENTVDNGFIADKVFMDNETAKAEFKSKLNLNGIEEVIKVPNSHVFDKKYSKQKIVLDNGITITIPTELIKNKDIVEFKTNIDGTTSVILKNTSWIKNKF